MQNWIILSNSFKFQFFSNGWDGLTKTNKLILTYTIISPKKKKNGGYVRDFNHNIDMEKINDEEYTPYELPFNKNTFFQFVSYLIPFQKKIIQQNTETLNTYQSIQRLIDDFVEE